MCARTGLVEGVDGLVGEIAVAHVALRKAYACAEGVVGIGHVVVGLIFLLDVVENLEGLFGSSGLYHYFLEAAFECSVFLDVLAVFVERGCADTLDFAARESGFEQVGCIHASGGVAGADYGVEFVDKEDYVGALRQLGQDGFDAFLKLAAVFRAGYNRGHIEAYDTLVEKYAAHLALNDAQRKPLYDSRFADSWLADEHRIVLLASAQHLGQSLDFLLAAHHGVETAFFGGAGDVVAEFVECGSVGAVAAATTALLLAGFLTLAVVARGRFVVIILLFLGRAVARSGGVLHIGDKTQHALIVHSGLPERHDELHMLYFGVVEQREKQMLGVNSSALEHACLQHRQLYQAVAEVAGYDFASERCGGIVERIVELLAQGGHRRPSGYALKQGEYPRTGVGEHSQKQVLGSDYAVVVANGLAAAVLQNLFDFV